MSRGPLPDGRCGILGDPPQCRGPRCSNCPERQPGDFVVDPEKDDEFLDELVEAMLRPIDPTPRPAPPRSECTVLGCTVCGLIRPFALGSGDCECGANAWQEFDRPLIGVIFRCDDGRFAVIDDSDLVHVPQGPVGPTGP